MFGTKIFNMLPTHCGFINPAIALICSLLQRTMIKPEIITMGCPDVDPEKMKGTYVEPREWTELIQDPELLLIGEIIHMYIQLVSLSVFFVQIHEINMRST